MKLAYLLLAVAVAFWIFYIGYTIHLRDNCDGHVVKNIFDWPVCVD